MARIAGPGLLTQRKRDNLGYTMPSNWAYDQIVTRWVGAGDGRIEIDHDIASGRDIGESSFAPLPPDVSLGAGLPDQAHASLLAEIRQAMTGVGIGETSANTKWSTQQSLDVVLHNDALITGMAQALKRRKSLIHVPVFWETRHYDTSLDMLGRSGRDSTRSRNTTSGKWGTSTDTTR